MPKTERAAKKTAAILAQLNAEVSAANTTIKDVAAELDMDYNTLRRYFKGEREFPMGVMWDVLEVLRVDDEVFLSRAKERASN